MAVNAWCAQYPLGRRLIGGAVPRGAPGSSSFTVEPSTMSKFALNSPSFDPGIGLKSTRMVFNAAGSSLVDKPSRALAGWPLTRICEVNTRRPFWLTAT